MLFTKLQRCSPFPAHLSNKHFAGLFYEYGLNASSIHWETSQPQAAFGKGQDRALPQPDVQQAKKASKKQAKINNG